MKYCRGSILKETMKTNNELLVACYESYLFLKPQEKENLLKLCNTFPGLSFTSESQNISLRSTSLITCILSSTMSLQVVSRSQVSSISFHSLSIHCLYHRSSQSHTNGLPMLYNVNFNLTVCTKNIA